MAAEAYYTNPNATIFNDAGLNAYPSLYADVYGQPKTDLIREDVRYKIFDSAPQEFYDLRIIGMQEPIQQNDTEYSWFEKGYGRDAILSTATVVGGFPQIVITVSQASLSVVTINTIVQFPNKQKGNVIAINIATNQITVLMQAGQIAPTVNNGDIINNFSSIEPDSVNNYSQNFRIQLIKRTNVIQQFVKGMQFGDIEMEKYKRSGTTDFLDMNRQEFVRQFRIDISNVSWLGTLGQINMSYGTPAKMTDGIDSLMAKANSPVANTTVANVGSALEAIALATEYGDYGQVKFAFMTPTMKNYMAKYYKYSLIRYNVTEGSTGAGGGTIAPLWMDAIDIGSTRINLVPYQRFQDTASFPVTMQNSIYLLDMKNIIPTYFMSESMIQTPNRRTGINLKTYTNFVMTADYGLQFNNPASSGLIIAN